MPQIIQLPGTESPLFSALRGLQSGIFTALQLQAEKRRQAAQDFAQAVQTAQLQKQAAAETPIEQVPTLNPEQMAAEQGIPPMHHDVASFAAMEPQPPRFITLKPPNGPEIKFPLQYKQEVEKQRLEDIEKAKIAEGGSIRVTPEMNAQLAQANPLAGIIYPAGTLMDKSVAVTMLRPTRHLQWIKKIDPNTGAEMTGVFDSDSGQEHWNPTSANGLTPNDFLSGEEFLKTLPPATAKLVQATAEGRNPPPSTGNRRDSPGFFLMQKVFQYAPGTDFNIIQARYAARKELQRGTSTSRGAAIDALNTLPRHIERWRQASNALADAGISTHDWELWNAGEQALMPRAKLKAVDAYQTEAKAVVDEFLKTITTGRPGVEEQKAYKDLQNAALPQANRDTIMDSLLGFAQDRMNVQEDWFQKTFGHSSVDDDQGLFPKKTAWKYDNTAGWHIPGIHEAPPLPGAGPTEGAPHAPNTTKGPTTISSKAEYDALPSGADIIWGPTGKRYKKP